MLSKVDIFDIRNNQLTQAALRNAVVNCSQKLISLIFGTTYMLVLNDCIPLWIALKSWYLWYSEQLIGTTKPASLVVNCSQKLISLIFGTTVEWWLQYRDGLWIALKSWYLWYSEQLIFDYLPNNGCCELLSKVDIFDIRNNYLQKRTAKNGVVNCSQKLISLIFGTTKTYRTAIRYKLWIALKSWYLWYSEQHNKIRQQSICSCELLSKVDIFDIRNNR